MPISDVVSPHGLLFALVVVSVIIVIAFFIFINLRWLIVDYYTTYAIRVHGGIRRFPTSITWLKTFSFENYEYIVKGRRNAERFKFFTRNRDEAGGWIVKKLQLMDRGTGAIDLRVHSIELNPFKVSSADHHDMEVHATIEFQLDRKRLFRCFQYADLGVALLTRLEGFIRAEINRRQNEKVAADITEIRKAIKEAMIAPEREDAGELAAWRATNGEKALTNAYFKGTELTALGIHITNLTLQVEQVDADTALPARPAGDLRESALLIPPRYLDDMRDMFARGDSDSVGANEALLRVLEMHTRENIARCVSKTGQMIIISSDDLGMARTSVFRGRLRNKEPAEPLDTPHAPDGEGGKDIR